MNDLNQVIELKQQGFFCSQILVLLGLKLQGKTNPDLIKSVQALAGGLGFSGNVCGALTGGACLLGLYAGKGKPEEEIDERLDLMVLSLVEWFEATTGAKYNGINCDQILEGSKANISIRCPDIVNDVFQKSKELLVEYGFNLDGSPSDG